MWSSARPGVATTTLRAALERAHLLEHRGAAVEGKHGQLAAPRVLVHRFGDLHRQLARRDEHEPRVRRRPRRRGSRDGAASAARTRRSCPCRWPPGRAGRGPRGGAESSRAGRGSAPRIRAPRPTRRSRRPARAWRIRSRWPSISEGCGWACVLDCTSDRRRFSARGFRLQAEDVSAPNFRLSGSHN